MAIFDKVKNLLAKNADKANTAIDKAGDLVDKRTQGKYAQQVNKVQDAAKKAVADNAGPSGQQQPPSAGGQPQPQQPPQQQQPPTAPPTS